MNVELGTVGNFADNAEKLVERVNAEPIKAGEVMDVLNGAVGFYAAQVRRFSSKEEESLRGAFDAALALNIITTEIRRGLRSMMVENIVQEAGPGALFSLMLKAQKEANK